MDETISKQISNTHVDGMTKIAPRGRVASTTTASSTNAAMKKKKSTSLPSETVEYLKAWMMSPEHIAHPYPTELEKAKIMQDTGIELKQLTNWFVNNRKRYWKPRVEAKLREQHHIIKSDGSALSLENINNNNSITTTAVITPTRSSRRIISTQTPTLIAPKQVEAAVSLPITSTSPTRFLVSEQNSVVSSLDSVSSSDNEDDENHDNNYLSNKSYQQETTVPIKIQYVPLQEQHKAEIVTVHILRPTGGDDEQPELSDVTILPNVPEERILHTYENCTLSYSYADASKAQSRRDAEIVRMKKYYLSLYKSEQQDAATIGKKRKEHEVAAVTALQSISNVVSTDEQDMFPRRKYRRVSIELWKEACQTASHGYDHDGLPSLEEATQLFGFAASS